MPKILVAVDGSENSARVIDFLIAENTQLKSPLHLHLINVQMPLGGVNVKVFISSDSLNQYTRKRARKRSMRPASASMLPRSPIPRTSASVILRKSSLPTKRQRVATGS